MRFRLTLCFAQRAELIAVADRPEESQTARVSSPLRARLLIGFYGQHSNEGNRFRCPPTYRTRLGQR